MSDMQDKILGRIRAKVEGAGLDYVAVPQWANTGQVYMQADLDTVWKLLYEFDSQSCSLHFSGPAVAAVKLSDNPPAYRFERDVLSFHALRYDEADRLRLMLELVESLTGVKA